MTRRSYHRQGIDPLRAAVAVLVLLSTGQFYVLYKQSDEIRSLSGTLDATTQVLQTTQAALQHANSEIDQLTAELNAKGDVIIDLSGRLGLAEREIAELTPTIKQFAVVGVTGSGEGIVIPLEVKLVAGDGSLSMNIKNVDLQTGVQESARTAADVAEDYTAESLAEKDLTISFINEGDVVTLDGPSAGAAMALAIIAALENETVRDDVLMTGAINPSGSIGPVGGVSTKAEAAEEWGAGTFLVPSGQDVTVKGLDVVEVDDIDEAVMRAFE